MDQPGWMAEAWRRLGIREIAGRRHNRDVLDFFRDAGRRDIVRDEVPWCAAFVGACLQRSGEAGTGSLLARSYLEWGEPLAAPRLGAVVVLTRGSDPGAGHVGFWLGETSAEHILLGGNQSDAVTVAAFGKERLLGFRWPTVRTQQSAPAASSGQYDRDAVPAIDHKPTFGSALAHVLAMEGGFTDDPDDPGGPTNKGITLEVYCRHTDKMLNVFTRAARVAELRDISDRLVRDIYWQRYWMPSRAAEMPLAVALMHFDASVNHGLTGAARLLQAAAARQYGELEIDGEIGPLTMNAVDSAGQAQLVRDYADVRRAKYRSLHHFWKFGRGWLNRVDRTEACALALLEQQPMNAAEKTQPAKGNDMTMTPSATPGTKWWGSSMTIWGAAITALSMVVPILGPALGLDVTPDAVRQVGEQVVSIVQAIGGLAGTIMTIYGRTRATHLLERRQLQVHI